MNMVRDNSLHKKPMMRRLVKTSMVLKTPSSFTGNISAPDWCRAHACISTMSNLYSLRLENR